MSTDVGVYWVQSRRVAAGQVICEVRAVRNAGDGLRWAGFLCDLKDAVCRFGEVLSRDFEAWAPVGYEGDELFQQVPVVSVTVDDSNSSAVVRLIAGLPFQSFDLIERNNILVGLVADVVRDFDFGPVQVLFAGDVFSVDGSRFEVAS